MSLKFYKNTRILLTGLLIALSSIPLSAAPVTLSSWNIEWLTKTPNPRFPQSLRVEDDFEALQRHLYSFNPDILAFQEVDSIEAIQKVVGSGYSIYLSQRADPENFRQQFDGTNQYTGFAVKSELNVTNVEDVRLVSSANSKLRFASYLIWHREDLPSVHLLSVHLKAGCSGKYSKSKSCKTLKVQGEAINGWIKARNTKQQPYIVLGDFNHNLAYAGDWLWLTMTSSLNHSPRLVTQKTKALCKVRSHKSEHKTHQFRSLIDHIIMSPDLNSSPAVQNVIASKEVLEFKMSDHCPISTAVY
ncbi:endonuclease/exonuclease/phosphatase family protein [Vibrio sp. ZSDZ34]|jgi:endonuclease/exonuclease/phosphatase family metal-dependent hydrolase|uniref:Endonuclease/exonuclease/phosphatase family protein n=1 Tax=Vibrio gelatinilyticus TaxID=2893468 RepID=A0A9X1WA40_9VIBR|nr:endonuclease/exonuclease/phosphatase family protein [Vibrio gelatinilyticus]MCJ2377177.1 endonuclease/exonuclease/phosphatase family protein [Vibrio gelatinilyticus]